jgi:hypothetical protein
MDDEGRGITDAGWSEGRQPLKRVWVQNVEVNARVLEARLRTLRARRGTDSRAAHELDRSVGELLTAARRAATRKDPVPGRVANWWRGSLIEAAYQNLHAAEALIVGLYDHDEVEAEIPEALARVEASLDRDDPRRRAVAELATTDASLDLDRARAELRKAIEVGHAAADHEHSRLRNFRNAVLISAAVTTVLVAAFTWYVSVNPAAVPFCFTPTPEPNQPAMLMCPTAEYEADALDAGPTSDDVRVVALLGLLGGALAAAVSIKNLSGTSTPYDVPFALAALKLPLGTLTAIGGLLVLRGQFVPGLSELDSQGQILAYALILGYAQQVLTGLIDKQADHLLASAPGKDTHVDRPQRETSGRLRPVLENRNEPVAERLPIE